MKPTDVSIWLKTQNELRSFVYRRVKDKALADDIVQDVFVKVFTNIASLQDTEKITGWIFQITRNAITDHFRKRAVPLYLSDLDDDTDVTNFNECVSSCLKDTLEHLPEKYRKALELTEFQNMSQLQLAEHLNISYSGARSRVQRARQMLREAMEHAYRIKLDPYGNAIACTNRIPCGCE